MALPVYQPISAPGPSGKTLADPRQLLEQRVPGSVGFMSRNARNITAVDARELLEHAPAALVATTMDGQILLVNQRASSLFGYEASGLHDQPFDTLLAVPSRATRAMLWQQYQADLASRDDLRLRGLHRDGSEFDLRISLGHASIGGAPAIMAAIHRAHGPMIKASREVAEAHTRALLNAIPDMMFHVSREGQYLGYKAEKSSDLLLSPEQVIGTNMRDSLMPPAVVDRLFAAIEHALEAGETATVEYDLQMSDTQRYYEARISQSGPDEVVCIVRDISDRARAARHIEELNQRLAQRNRELEASNQELESFSYSVSHDLRAPLRTIDGFSMMLANRYADVLDDNARGLLDRVRGAAQRMAGLIDDLLCLSRITRSKLCCERIDLSTLAGEVTESLRAAQPDRSVEMIIAPDVTCFGDANLLRILLDNMLSNAWKYTSQRPHARVEIGTTEQEGEQVYCVRDNGAGFDMKYASKLFTAFQRLHTIHEFPGNGIGLATAARIVHRHGGRIWAEAAVDQGASFYFTLAAKDDE